MNDLRIEKRKGWSRACPSCQQDIRYTVLTNPNGPTPFFYADDSNDVLLRRSDQARVDEVLLNGTSDIGQLIALWEDILASAPPAPSGGSFALWSNVQCPHCHAEIPYNNGIRDANIRIHDSKIIVVEGAVVVGDNPEDLWKAEVSL